MDKNLNEFKDWGEFYNFVRSGNWYIRYFGIVFSKDDIEYMRSNLNVISENITVRLRNGREHILSSRLIVVHIDKKERKRIKLKDLLEG